MNKKTLKDMGIVTADELGIDTKSWGINTNDIYQIDVETCHRQPVNFNETIEKTTSVELGKFASYGRIANFDWVALTQVFSSTLFKSLSDDKQKQNRKHSSSIAMGYQLGQYLNQAIQDSSLLGIRLRQCNCVVPNTEELAWRGIHEHTSHMAIHIRKFLGLELDNGLDLAIEDNHLVAKKGQLSELKGKDVILPFIYANVDSIKLYGQVANIICNFAKANTVTGIFITRLMPTMDGRNPNSLAQDEYVPIISPYFGMEIPPIGY